MIKYVMVLSSALTNTMVNRSTSHNIDCVRRATFSESWLKWFQKDVEYAILEFDTDDEKAAELFIDEYWLSETEIKKELEGEKLPVEV